MFTGIIEEQGRIRKLEKTSSGMNIDVECSKVLEDIVLGASISVNGACQTVTSFGRDYFSVFSSNETLKVTNYKDLKQGGFVNLERALTLNKRIDGHIVSGHIDCIAEFIKIQPDGLSKRLIFKLPGEFSKYAIYKGSIAVNGVSLTIASIEKDIFSCAVIPLTLEQTNLGSLKPGAFVNIETDLFAKYIEKIVKSNNRTKISIDFLSENGFI